MTRLMPSPSQPRWKRALDHALRLTRISGFGDSSAAAGADDAAEALRSALHSLIEDLAPDARHMLALRILHARDRDELWHLRSAVYGAVARQLGEQVAQERLRRLDDVR